MGRRMWKVLGVVLSLVFLVSGIALAGGQKDKTGATSKPVIRFLMGDMGRTKFTKDTYIMKLIAEKMGNVDLDLVLVPRSDMSTKFNTLIAAGDLPDIMMVEGAYDVAMEYGPKGLFYPVDTKLAAMPELAKIRQMIPDYDKIMRAEDGHMYAFSWVAPYKFFTLGVLVSPAFKKVGYDPRKDLDTMESFYTALTKVKALDPKSYPWVTRSGDDLGRTWLMFGVTNDFMPDPATGKYIFGAVDNRFRTMLSYMAKAYAEGIMHPDFFTMKEETWRELFAAGKAHFTVDNYSQATVLGTDPNNTDTWLTSILPPKVEGKRWYASLDRGSVSPGEGVWLINSKTRYIDNLIKFCDWGYSEEGFLDSFYGKVGEVSTVTPDGFRKFVIPDGKKFPNVWKGDETINTLGLRQYTYVFRASLLKDQLNPAVTEQVGGNLKAISYQTEVDSYYGSNNVILPATPLLKFKTDELDTVKQLRTPISTFAMENAVKFIRGERSLGEWDKYVADVKAMGLDRLLKVYDAAYARFNTK